MTKLLLATVTSTLLAVAALAATTCPADVTSKALAVATNATYLNTCAPGSKWKLTSLFEAANLTASDFLTFCNATACMTPMHKLVDEIPDGCVATVNGTSVVLGDVVGAVHGKCHDALHKAGIADDDDDDDDHDHDHAASKNGSAKANSSDAKTVPSSAPAPTPKKSTASTMTQATIAVTTVAATIAALVL
jgi:hypothetical protein